MTSRLNNLRVYLSGSCENSKGDGGEWRRNVTPVLKNLGLTVFDPVNSPIVLSFKVSKEDQFDYVKTLRDKGLYDELAKCMREVVHLDLRFVDCSDLLIVRFDVNSPSTGTIDELTMACNQRKPVYVYCEQGKKGIPLWIWGRIPPNYVYNSLDEIIEELKKIAFTNINVDTKRWLFLNNLGI